jgi:dihydrofolate reductase
MPSLFAIAVIGQRGQLVTPADTPWFREMTWGHRLMLGAGLAGRLPFMPGRFFTLVDLDPERETSEMMREYVRNTATENVFLIGGAETFAKFACVVDRWYIDKTGFDGPSDEWFSPMWLVAESE